MAVKLFITGTDTDIGKTVVSALLAEYLDSLGINCGYLKLVSCGGNSCEDSVYVQNRATVPVQNVYHFPLAASPHLAAEQDGQNIEIGKLNQAMAEMEAEHDVLLIEGAGGICVPLTREVLLVDYIAGHAVQTLVVARSGLGTINHTLLTLEGLKQRGLDVLGIVFSDEQSYPETDLLVNDNIVVTQQFTGESLLGRLPSFKTWQEGRQGFAAIGSRILDLLSLEPQDP